MGGSLNRRTQLDEALDALLTGANVEPMDPEIRELLRLAMRIRHEREALTNERRAALRARVLRRLDVAPRPTLGERLAMLAALLWRPAPLLARTAAAVLLLGALGAGATIASAESLPDDALYGVKIASEELRLALAQTPEDRAAVELTIAEHRLQEATALAQLDRDAEADAAVSEFGEHLAIAAAYLEEAAPAASPTLLEQLRARVVQQQQRLLATSVGFAANASSTAFTVLTEMTATIAGGDASGAGIADVAARGAQQAATFAVDRVPRPNAVPAPTRPGTTARPVTARPTATETPMSSGLRAKLEAAAKAAQEAAERARQAAERARNAAQAPHQTPSPSPSPKR